MLPEATSSSIIIAAVGDLSFEGALSENPSGEVFSAVQDILKGTDLTIANLEGPLLLGGIPVLGKCTLRGVPAWAQVIRQAGIQVLSLANNHSMDYGIEGLQSTIEALDKVGLYYVGAGRDKDEACAPRFMEIAGQRVAFLGRTSVPVSSPSYAGERQAGVAFLDVEETIQQIKLCRQYADLVILLIHWGLEEYEYPSPEQRLIARKFIDAGADLILGHHPHVLQGVEYIGKGLVCYSLGNFVFDEFEWVFFDDEGQREKRQIDRLSPENRKGGILRVNFSGGTVRSYDFLPTYIPTDAKVEYDTRVERKKEMGRLISGLGWPTYSLFWHAYSVTQEWRLRLKPLLRGKISWRKIRKIRTTNFRHLLASLRRSARITLEKSTNPYE